MALAIRPVPVKQDPRTLYTIHSEQNRIFTLRIHKKSRTSVVAFRLCEDAVEIGKMMDTHVVQRKEWPDILTEGSLVLPSPLKLDILTHVYIQKWDFSDIQILCAKNFLDFMTVDSLVNKKTGISFEGNVVRFEGNDDFYKERLEELFGM